MRFVQGVSGRDDRQQCQQQLHSGALQKDGQEKTGVWGNGCENLKDIQQTKGVRHAVVCPVSGTELDLLWLK